MLEQLKLQLHQPLLALTKVDVIKPDGIFVVHYTFIIALTPQPSPACKYLDVLLLLLQFLYRKHILPILSFVCFHDVL